MSELNAEPLLHRLRSPRRAAIAAVALLAIGGGAGAVAMQAARPAISMAPAIPVPIRSLSSNGIVTIRGNVAEIYGNKFIIQDAGGRALVDTGRAGEDARLVTAGEVVTVQGRFDHGFVHAAFLAGPDNKVTALGPLGGPHGGPGHHGRRHGPADDENAPPPAGAERDDDASSQPPVSPGIPGAPAAEAAGTGR